MVLSGMATGVLGRIFDDPVEPLSEGGIPSNTPLGRCQNLLRYRSRRIRAKTAV
jgi:hypothetical protein